MPTIYKDVPHVMFESWPDQRFLEPVVRPADRAILRELAETIGQIGYSGSGIDKARSHLHFEINLLANRSFQGWYNAHMKEPNWQWG